MTDPTTADLRSGLIDNLRACREAERAIFAALDPATRDAPGPDGDWSPKDKLAHLSAWRNRHAAKMAALREGRDERREEAGTPDEDIETDATNAIIHDERADWTWDRVESDADASAEAVIAEIAAASDAALTERRILNLTMGNGSEHDQIHLAAIARAVGMSDRLRDLADQTVAMLDRGAWPARPAADARYNLACFHALNGDLDVARALLRQALPGQDELIAFAPTDDDLIALRDEIPALASGGDGG